MSPRLPDRSVLGEAWPGCIFLVLFAILVVLKNGFTGFDLVSLCQNVLPLALIAIGQYFVVLARGIDLSLGPIASVASCCAALLLGHSTAAGFLVPVAAGAVAGAVNGFLVVRFELPPIIVTLATMSVWQGVALLVLPTAGGDIPPDLQDLLTNGTVLGVAIPLLLLVVAVLVGTWTMRTPLGLYLRAVGGEETAARLSGVAIARTKVIAYVLGGVMAALGGIYATIATSSGSPTLGDDYILVSVAAVSVGGIPLAGGRGAVFNVLVGALTLTVIGSLLYFANISNFYQSVVNGAILVAVVALGTMREWNWRGRGA